MFFNKIYVLVNQNQKEIKIEKKLNTNQLLNIFLKTLLFLLTVLIIHYSPPILEKIQPDSHGYIDYNKTRQTFYFLLYQFLNKLNVDIIFFQNIFLSFSIVLLVNFINEKTNKFFSIASYLLIVTNIYYTSFSKTILTESIFFSLFNIAVVLFFRNERKKNFIIFGLVCGCLASLKPIGIPISLFLIFISSIRIKKINRILLMLVFFIIPQLIENITFFSKFNERETVFKMSVVGKLFLLSGKDSFNISDYPENLNKLLIKSKAEFKPIHKFLDSLDSTLLKAELLADYEVVAQYQTFNFDSIKQINFDKRILFDNSLGIFSQILKNNFLDYLYISYQHYIGNWSIGSKVRKLQHIELEIPRYKELIKSSGPMNIPNLRLIEFAQLIFLLLFFIVIIFTLIIILTFCRVIKSQVSYIDYVLICLLQLYLLLICLTNVSTPRYLMLVYPMIIFISMRFVSFINNKIIKINK